jgi:Ser/Thr protein kinase RdoA (MazF antagonist)
VETKSSQTLVQRGKNRYALFDYVVGSFRSFDYIAFPKQTHQYIAIAGEMLAILHDKLADFTPQGYNPDGFKSKTGDRWRDIEWFADKLAFSVNKTSLRNENRPKHKYTLLLQNARKLKTILFDNTYLLNSTDLPRQIIHADYHPGHLLLRKNEPPVIIDFEIARFDWRLIDIIYGLQTFCKNRRGYYCHNKIRTFLSNYQFIMPLTPTELKFFPSVWKLMQTWWCIFSWHQHCSIDRKGALIRACQKLKDLDWVTANQDAITTTLTKRIE